MPEQFLYQTLDAVSIMGFLKKEIPDSVTLNLNPMFELRKYQIEAFARFFHCYKNEFPNKTYPLHLLFNMATGSGKTLIMAGLILYLYEEGYRNFLFFVNSTNIIEKTKDNFLNPASIKYLYNRDITIENRRVQITPVNNFEGVNQNDINICFTTIQKLHSDLTTEKENAITYEDFRKHRIILIADEAHHMNVSTKSGLELFESWENTVQNIFEQNRDNILLEFTATHDFATPAMVDKYRDRVIFRYDLPEFRNDKFSKDITLIYSDFDLDDRIIQALILSYYKQFVASKYRINLKPVILFKAQRTIAQSQENKENFHKIIEGLTSQQVARIRKSNIPIVQRAFAFFAENNITDAQLVERLKREFHEEFCLSVNNESEKETYQILVNTLEDKDNRIRAIFAVQKLNEGWDVLNLFDIVRCYEARDTGRAKIGKTTMSEAQLIGRGARYFPFVLPENSDRFRRKYDNDLDNELRVIEELHYHSINDSRYISEIRAALIEQGMMDENVVERQLTLKDAFKSTEFYRYGLIYKNDRIIKDYHRVNSIADLGVTKRNYEHSNATGVGGTTTVFDGGSHQAIIRDRRPETRKVSQIEKNIIQSAIARNPFFTFASLKRYLPNLNSMQEFIKDEEYLANLEITFVGNTYNLDENKEEKLKAVLGLLGEIENQIRANVTEYKGTREFNRDFVHKVFTDKTLRYDNSDVNLKEDDQLDHDIQNREWFAFNHFYGTSEEGNLIKMIDSVMHSLKERFNQVYLLRNEGHFAIYDFEQGIPFEPDFVLFLEEKDGQSLIYQMFIEPKGGFLQKEDKWKEDFLKDIKAEFGDKVLRFGGQAGYRLIGVPFYNVDDENRFKEELFDALA